VRRETSYFTSQSAKSIISIHSLREKGDKEKAVQKHLTDIFQSTPFVRRETKYDSEVSRIEAFQSTPFVRRETAQILQDWIDVFHFNPLPS